MNLNKLKNALNDARPFLHNQDYIPILTHFAFTGHSVIAYNDVQAVEVNLETNLECAIPGNMLTRLLNTISSDSVEIFQKGMKVEIGSGRSKTKLSCLPKSDFVFSMPESQDEAVKIPSEILDGVRRCLLSVIENPAHQELNGITWEIDSQSVTLYATDNKTISRFVLNHEINTPPGKIIKIVIPTMFCEQLVNLAKTYKGDDEYIQFIFSKEYVLAIYPNCKLFSRLLVSDGLMDFKSVISRYLPDEEKLVKDKIPFDMMPAISRAALIAEDKLASNLTHVTVEKNEVALKTEGPYGRARDTIDFETDFGEFSYSIDSTLVERALKVTDAISFQPKVTLLQGYEGRYTYLVSHSRG